MRSHTISSVGALLLAGQALLGQSSDSPRYQLIPATLTYDTSGGARHTAFKFEPATGRTWVYVEVDLNGVRQFAWIEVFEASAPTATATTTNRPPTQAKR